MDRGVCDYRACSRPSVWDITAVTPMAVLEIEACDQHRNEMIPREARECTLVKVVD